MEIESDCDLERVQAILPSLFNPDPATIEGCKAWASKVLAVAETQSSKMGKSSGE
jgi:hypothetical protein|tara:strand:+ start:383 stop:547 length:165 start_codon:yes stop_codon:yes gene_type:complete